MQLFNEIDSVAYKNFDSFVPCDAYLTAAFLFPKKCIRTKQQYHATIELQGVRTRGQVVIDHTHKNKSNVTIIETLYEEEVKNALLFADTP